MKNPLNIVIATTTDQERAESSRWRWFDDKSGVYRLRVRGILPYRWFL